MSSPALILVQPLQSLPSVLAISDLRRRTTAVAFRSFESRESLAELLALDPLTILRALRAIAAPMHGSIPCPTTVRGIVDTLGATAVRRMLDVPEVEPERTRRIRMLWKRSVARACAARLLAPYAGASPPDEAYLSALLRDLDAWLRHLGLHHNGIVPTWRGADLVRHWGLGALLRASGLQPRPIAWQASPADTVRARPECLFDAADALAAAAGFPHPDEDDGGVPPLDPMTADDVEVLRRDIHERFARFGLTVAGETEAECPAPDIGARTPAARDRTDMIPRLLECRRTTSGSGLAVLSVSAALRYLDFDRAFVIGWNPDIRRAWVRAKADGSRLPLDRRPVRPTEREADALADARGSQAVRILVRGGASDGLCGHLGSDRALAIPLSPQQQSPTFLVIDRALTARPIAVETESEPCRELAGFLTLLFDNLDLRLRRRRAQRSATLDRLTGLANRGVGIFTLERTIAATKRSQSPLCAMMLDLDDFKLLNDRYGHLVGDQALRLAASVLRRNVRGSDTVCRYGGEEFLVVLPDTHPDEATILATRLFTEVAEAGRAANLPLTVSIGLASLRPIDDLDALVARADRALYASKSRGRNRFSADTD